jgi:hypothetical protein
MSTTIRRPGRGRGLEWRNPTEQSGRRPETRNYIIIIIIIIIISIIIIIIIITIIIII